MRKHAPAAAGKPAESAKRPDRARAAQCATRALKSILASWATLLSVSALAFLMMASGPAAADERSFINLSDLPLSMAENALARLAGGSFRGFDSARCASGSNPGGRSTSVLLDVQYGAYSIYNPSTNAYDRVNLRTYNGCPTGPTVSINPGATLSMRVRNDLPAETASSCPTVMDPTRPACFNTVNLHLHGLHVSPSGHADNVLLHLAPGTSFQYQYDIPANHPAGTFWYHSHSHGSTAIDVSSGMEGVLIVRGTRTAAARARNDNIADIDTILHRPVTRTAFPEHVFLFQQIEYGCFQDANATSPIADATTYAWLCPGGKVGELRNYTGQLNFVPDPRPAYAGRFDSTWSISGRYTQINGVVQPVFPSAHGVVAAGEIRRLRLVHGGNRDSINFKIVKADLSAFGGNMTGTVGAQQLDAATREVTALLSGRSPVGQATTLDKVCSGEVVEQEEIAVDGLTRSAIAEKAVNSLSPGYRSDVLVAFPSPGVYCILDEAADAAATVNYRAGASRIKDRRLLSFARVGPGVNIPEYSTDGAGHTKYWQYVRNQLVAANMDLPGDVLANLRGLNTTAFAPKTEIAGVVSQKAPTVFSISASGNMVINGATYDPNRIDYTATLGTVDEWRVSAAATGGHIFHIHVNPFEVVDILNGAGASIYDTAGACTAAEIATGDTQYCGLYHVFRDTLFVKAGYTAVLHTKYEDYTGEFVMHCHILDHEDQGMMQNISIISSKTALWRKVVNPIVAASRRAEDTVRLWAGLPARRPPLLVDGLLDAPLCRALSSGQTGLSRTPARL